MRRLRESGGNVAVAHGVRGALVVLGRRMGDRRAVGSSDSAAVAGGRRQHLVVNRRPARRRPRPRSASPRGPARWARRRNAPLRSSSRRCWKRLRDRRVGHLERHGGVAAAQSRNILCWSARRGRRDGPARRPRRSNEYAHVLDIDLFHRREIHHRAGAVRAVVQRTTSGSRRPGGEFIPAFGGRGRTTRRVAPLAR